MRREAAVETVLDVLVVEDQRNERSALARLFRAEGLSVETAATVAEATKWLGTEVGVIVSDLRLGNETALDLLRQSQTQAKQIPFVILTAYGDVPTAVAAIKQGAEEFLTKPVDPPALIALVHQLLRNRRAQAAASAQVGSSRLVGTAPTFIEAMERLGRVAPTDSTVLLLGESGTGKELFAREIHARSGRAAGPFLAANVAALPEPLVESEFFGHTAGSFTGAIADRVGWFEAARGGTLFIDEIGDLPLAAQPKLLRALETKSVTRIGSTTTVPVDVRVVAATGRDLAAMVAAKEFREDLFYRINVISITLPPLRERLEDLPLLIEQILAELSARHGVEVPAIEPDLLAVLRAYPWPGNIRQLRNVLESMLVLGTGASLVVADLPPEIAKAALPLTDMAHPADQTLANVERALVLQTLARFGGNRTKAAEALGISRRTLQRWLHAWGESDADGPEVD